MYNENGAVWVASNLPSPPLDVRIISVSGQTVTAQYASYLAPSCSHDCCLCSTQTCIVMHVCVSVLSLCNKSSCETLLLFCALPSSHYLSICPSTCVSVHAEQVFCAGPTLLTAGRVHTQGICPQDFLSFPSPFLPPSPLPPAPLHHLPCTHHLPPPLATTPPPPLTTSPLPKSPPFFPNWTH